ncbi:MAG TPA: hypothetical protein VFU59_02660, partial [Candidatus Eisenbacteria bacterium]|nr:hypothetical protein [Candidatus Eisenbacteria bacterium]
MNHMPPSKPAPPVPDPPANPRSRNVLALGVVALTAAAVWAGLHPGPRNWGLHAPGFLPPSTRNLLLAAMVLSAAVALAGLLRPAGRAARNPSKSKRAAWPAQWPWILVVAWLGFGSLVPVKEALLGDSAIWIQAVQTDTLKLSSEPLAGRVLGTVADGLRAKGAAIDPSSLGVVSRVLAVPAAALSAGVAMEIAGSAGGAWGVPLALLLTLGTSQLYFGYVESYPIAFVLMLLVLWLGLRALRGASPVALAGAAIGVAGAGHFVALLLFPGYVYLVLRRAVPIGRRILELLLPPAVLVVVCLLLRYDLREFAHPFRVATQSVDAVRTLGIFQRPYGAFSAAHANDVINAALLAAPVALLLLAAGALALSRRWKEWDPRLLFLAAAAAGGGMAACALMTPVAPVQDWDLFALLIAPAGILGVAVASIAAPAWTRGTTGLGLAAL